MSDSLSDRQFEAFRRVRPNRVVQNRKDIGLHSEEYAIAVTDADGNPITADDASALSALLTEQQLTNRLLGQILIQLGGFYAAEGFSIAS